MPIPEYPDLESVFEDYARGCPGRIPRVRESVLATVGSAIRYWERFAIPLEPYLQGLGANRIAFAAILVAVMTFKDTPFHRTAIDIHSEACQHLVRSKPPYPWLFVDTNPLASELGMCGEEAQKLFLRASLNPLDFRKRIPWNQDRYCHPEEEWTKLEAIKVKFGLKERSSDDI